MIFLIMMRQSLVRTALLTVSYDRSLFNIISFSISAVSMFPCIDHQRTAAHSQNIAGVNALIGNKICMILRVGSFAVLIYCTACDLSVRVCRTLAVVKSVALGIRDIVCADTALDDGFFSGFIITEGETDASGLCDIAEKRHRSRWPSASHRTRRLPPGRDL